jgi:hypothetical protein
MERVPLDMEMQEQLGDDADDLANAGPYLAISRQFGCHGFSLGLMLVDRLTDVTEEHWDIQHKEILTRLATETDVAEDLLETQRRAKPSLWTDFFRSFGKGSKLPSGFEVRNRITTIIRGLAARGNTLIIGQGAAIATSDIPNGLRIRLEANLEWRVKQIAFREGIGETEARLMVKKGDEEREYLRKIYERRSPIKPAFDIVYDCSHFTLAELAQHIVYAMKLRKLI